jgi:hypothetical protein
MDDSPVNGYIPGHCNIGEAEIRRRKKIGYQGLWMTLVVFLLLEITDARRIYRAFVFPFLFYALSGFVQARHHFCYLYGWKGIFSITGRKQFEKVQDPKKLRSDRITAVIIVVMVTFGSVLLTAMYMVI